MLFIVLHEVKNINYDFTDVRHVSHRFFINSYLDLRNDIPLKYEINAKRRYS